MSAIKFDTFGGQIPLIDDRLLPKENASFAKDAFLQSGRLEPLAADILLWTLVNPDARWAFRVPISDPSVDRMLDSYWIEFADMNTTGVRSPVADTAEGGIFYFASPTMQPMYTTKQRISVADPMLVLGIPTPATAPTVVPDGSGSPPTETRAYTYSWVSAYGEEGPPAPPTLATGNANDVWNITMTAPTLADTTDRNLVTTRIWRTETGSDGNAGFFFVADVPIATLTFADNVSGDIVVNSEELQSETWTAPPVDLQGMVSMPNGMIAGWRENQVWFCEPYRPHAWPIQYQINVEFPIIGLGTIDQNLMVLTSGQPYAAVGIHPSAMALRQVQPLEPCTSMGSIVSTDQGVLYTSNNGLIQIGPSGGKNLTFDIIRKDDWLNITNLSTLRAAYFMGGYYAYAGVTEGVFQDDTFQMDAFQEENAKGSMQGFHLSLSDQHLGFMTLTSDTPTYNVLTDSWTGELMVIRDGQVFHVDRRMFDPRRTYLWRSKIFELLYKENYAVAKIFYTLPNGSPPSMPTMFRYYADGLLKMERVLPATGVMFRLPSGFKADTIQFELEGQLMIYSMQVGTTAESLRTV